MTTKAGILSSTLGLAALLLAAPVLADSYVIDPGHSSVGFEVRHLAISKTRGRFHDFAGRFEFTPGTPQTWSVEATIQAASIDTDNEDRDRHLRSPEFLDVERFPTLAFRSTAVEMENGTEGILRGELTLYGVTRVVELDLEFLGAVTDPYGNERAGFTATTEIDRKDYGLTWSKTVETGGLVVGDEVRITLEIEGTKEK